MDYKYTSIILSKRDVGETDRIYTIYTLEKGKIRVLAKGVRKSQAKLAGSLESFTLADISTVRKNGIGKVTGSIIEKDFYGIKNNLELVSSVFWSIKILDKLTQEEEGDKKIFALLKEYLESVDSLSNKRKIKILSGGFIVKLLSLLGYHLETGSCVGCRSNISRKGNFFSPENGGVICNNCGQEKGGLEIGENTIKTLRIFFQNDIKSLSKLRITRSEEREMETVLKKFIEWIN